MRLVDVLEPQEGAIVMTVTTEKTVRELALENPAATECLKS